MISTSFVRFFVPYKKVTMEFPCHIFCCTMAETSERASVEFIDAAKSTVADTSSAGGSAPNSDPLVEEVPPLRREFRLIEKPGNLFDSEDDALAHCVSSDLAMGRGIAVEFVQRYGGRDELQAQPHAVGDVPSLVRDARSEDRDKKLRVYFMVTKPRYFHKPTAATLRQALDTLATHCIVDNIQTLSMPRIACGLDRMRWDNVERMIRAAFAHTSVHVTVYSGP